MHYVRAMHENDLPLLTASVAFDLDLTLVDTRDLSRGAVEHINSTYGTAVAVEEFVQTTGLPVREQLAKWVPDAQLDEVIHGYRQWIVEVGLDRASALPSARDALERAMAFAGATAVVTSRLDWIGKRLLSASGLSVDALIGNRTGAEKAPAIRDVHAVCYVGDHPLDMVGARMADTRAIGVLTGMHSREELLDAGAHAVINDLSELTSGIMAGK